MSSPFNKSNASSGVSGVSSFNTRTGAVTFAVSDIPQDGAGTNNVLQWNGSAWVPAAVAGGADATGGAVVGANTAIGSSAWATWLTTVSLATGTYLFTVAATTNASAVQESFLRIANGTATATISGPTSISTTAASSSAQVGSFSTLVIVTVAGTMVIQGWGSVGGLSVLASDPVTAQAGVSGYSWTKVA